MTTRESNTAGPAGIVPPRAPAEPSGDGGPGEDGGGPFDDLQR